MPRFSRARSTRKFHWEGAGIQGAFPALADSAVVAFWARIPAGVPDTAFSDFRNEPDQTVTRTRALITCSTSNGGAQTSATFLVSAGLIAWDGVTDDANDLGLIPNPCSDVAADWIWRWSYPRVFTNEPIISNVLGDVDGLQSLAQRKMPNNTGVLFTFGFQSIALSPASLDVYLAAEFRFLVKAT